MNWRDSPLFVATASAVATATLLIAIYTYMVIPPQVEGLKNEIAYRQHEIAELRKQVGDFGTAKDILDAQNKRIVELEAEIAKGRLGWTIHFRADNPYPVEILNIIIGTSIANFRKTYAFNRDQIETNNLGWLSMNLASGPFMAVAVYYDSESHSPTVTGLLFHCRNGEALKVILNESLKAFGSDSVKYQKIILTTNGDKTTTEEQWMWKNIDGVDISVRTKNWLSGLYELMPHHIL